MDKDSTFTKSFKNNILFMSWLLARCSESQSSVGLYLTKEGQSNPKKKKGSPQTVWHENCGTMYH